MFASVTYRRFDGAWHGIIAAHSETATRTQNADYAYNSGGGNSTLSASS
jgi:hypothetical protein